MYLIQGVFFQNYTGLGVSLTTGEARVVIQTSLAHPTVFHGLIGHRACDLEEVLSGEIDDQFGHAKISEIEIDDQRLNFTKKYSHPRDRIVYSLRLNPADDLLWEGEYKGDEQVGSGFVRCVIVKVDDDFLIPPLEVLEKAKREYDRERIREQELHETSEDG